MYYISCLSAKKMTAKRELQPYLHGASGTVQVPGSKSLTNRALLLCALAEGKSTLTGGLESDDSQVMQAALADLGVVIEKAAARWSVSGNGGFFTPGNHELYLGNAGTAMRFLTAAAGLMKGRVRLHGKRRMHERPIADLIDALKQLGVSIKSEANNGCPPVIIDGNGELRGGNCVVSGSISSQFLSALLQIAPLTKTGVQLHIKPPLVSRPYLQMTIGLLHRFGIKVIEHSELEYEIAPQALKPIELCIEGDASASAHVFALAVAAGGEITINNFPQPSLQGDAAFLDVLRHFGASVETAANGTTVRMESTVQPLGAIDLEHIPDAGMSAVVLAALANGKSRFTGMSTLRHKECDRIAALEQNLIAAGANVSSGPDWIEVDGNPQCLHGAEIETFDDHRVAMSLAAIGAATPGIIIHDPTCVNKTFPTFWDVFEACRKQ